MKKHKIPDWWRCEKCKWYVKSKDNFPGNYCNNKDVKEEITLVIGSWGGTSVQSFGFRFKPTFGCIHFKSRDESDEQKRKQ